MAASLVHNQKFLPNTICSIGQQNLLLSALLSPHLKLGTGAMFQNTEQTILRVFE